MSSSKFNTARPGLPAYKTAAERLWEKLEFWTNDIDLEVYDPEKDMFKGTWNVIAASNDLLDFLVDEVNEECVDSLNELYKDWAIYMFLHQSMEAYNKEFDRSLEVKE